MLTPRSFDEYNIPVPIEWKLELARNLAETVSRREQSYDASLGAFGGYKLSISEAAELVCVNPMTKLVVQCLQGSWNESLDFAESYGEDV